MFIADGHHRYTTAMNYRQALIDAGGPLPEDHPAYGEPQYLQSASSDTFCLVWFDFEPMDWQGWKAIDNWVQIDTFFHIDDFGIDRLTATTLNVLSIEWEI